MSDTIELLSRQQTNWRTTIPKKFSHFPENSKAHTRFPNLGIWQRDWLREFDFEGQWNLIIELPQDWGNRLLEATNKTFCTPRPRGKEQWPIRDWARLACECQESLVKMWVYSGLMDYRSTEINHPESESESHSVVSESLQPHGLYSPWNSPGQNTGVGSLYLLQETFQTEGLNPGLPQCRWSFTSWATREAQEYWSG